MQPTWAHQGISVVVTVATVGSPCRPRAPQGRSVPPAAGTVWSTCARRGPIVTRQGWRIASSVRRAIPALTVMEKVSNGGKDNPNAAGGWFCKYKMMYKRWIMTKTLAYGYLSESTQRELSNEYQHDRVLKVYKSLFIFVLWQKKTLDIYYPLCWWWLILLIQNGTKMLKNDWNSGIWVLIWEYSVRAIQWIPTWQGFDGVQKYLCFCALDERSLSIGRVNPYNPSVAHNKNAKQTKKRDVYYREDLLKHIQRKLLIITQTQTLYSASWCYILIFIFTLRAPLGSIIRYFHTFENNLGIKQMFMKYLFYCVSGNTEPTALCSAGFYCTLNASTSTPRDGTTGDTCPPGLYCVTGSVTGQGCPKGSFSNRTGLVNATQCDSCTPGHYCSQTGLTQVSGTCWAGKLQNRSR